MNLIAAPLVEITEYQAQHLLSALRGINYVRGRPEQWNKLPAVELQITDTFPTQNTKQVLVQSTAKRKVLRAYSKLNPNRCFVLEVNKRLHAADTGHHELEWDLYDVEAGSGTDSKVIAKPIAMAVPTQRNASDPTAPLKYKESDDPENPITIFNTNILLPLLNQFLPIQKAA